jgi:F-type H+-transporting ATPase subunit gamma
MTSCAGSSPRIIELVDLREVKQLGFVNAETIAQNILDRASPMASSTSRRCSIEVQVGDRADPDGAADHPGRSPAGAKTTDAVYEYEPEESEILETLLPRNLAVQIFRALLENNAASELWARRCPRWTTRRAMPAR